MGVSGFGNRVWGLGFKLLHGLRGKFRVQASSLHLGSGLRASGFGLFRAVSGLGLLRGPGTGQGELDMYTLNPQDPPYKSNPELLNPELLSPKP